MNDTRDTIAATEPGTSIYPLADWNASPIDPICFAFNTEAGTALAVISDTEGSSYCPKGAMMAIRDDGTYAGSLSSGCIEADIVCNAIEALETKQARTLWYGAGSPFQDLKLPCGGAMEVLIVPRPDSSMLQIILERHSERKSSCLVFERQTGAISLCELCATKGHNDLIVAIQSELKFLVFGSGPEAISFTGLAKSLGFVVEFRSPCSASLDSAGRLGCQTEQLTSPQTIFPIDADYRTAVVLFFHDHEWEPQILKMALHTKAFYIGAQGSMRTKQFRESELMALGAEPDQLKRLYGPIGLIKSARDPKTLAVSVIAEILEAAQNNTISAARQHGVYHL